MTWRLETVEEERADQTHSPNVTSSKNRGDKGVHGFWKRGRLCIFDVRITDTECRTTRNQDPERVLQNVSTRRRTSTYVPVWNVFHTACLLH